MEPTPKTYGMPPHRQYTINPFLSAAITCAGISVVMMCIPFASISFAALGILFAILSKGSRTAMSPIALISVGTCMVTMTFSLLFSIFAVWFVLNNPEQRAQLNTIYEQSTGITFDDALDGFLNSLPIQGVK